ncbi:MAG: hypothetical protein BGO98_05690 [Myxococcales bacterium 68-20]|nr:hypothetical protein [Myxococcales bacterium]OJY28564.1 MAG: hypothetical protein BGO98_05690 [Myxococcales bacterium 68-20]
MARNLFVFVLVLSPLAAHAACAASNGEALPAEVREAGSLEASNGRRGNDDDDDDSSTDGGDERDEGDAGKDARVEDDGGASSLVEINEIYVDIDGLGDGAEFVELRAEPGTPVDDLKLRILDATGAVKYLVNVGEPGAKVSGSGLWVVGGNQTFKLEVLDRVDKTVSLSAWGLENTHGAVQLVRGMQLLDVVGWTKDADAGAVPPPGLPPKATAEGTPAMLPTIRKTSGKPAHSFGRRSGAPDTNDNRADFCSMAASPGYDQKPCD